MPQQILRILESGADLKSILLEKIGDPEVDEFLGQMVVDYSLRACGSLPFDLGLNEECMPVEPPSGTIVTRMICVDTDEETFGQAIFDARIPGTKVMVHGTTRGWYLVPMEAEEQLREIAGQHGVEL